MEGNGLPGVPEILSTCHVNHEGSLDAPRLSSMGTVEVKGHALHGGAPDLCCHPWRPLAALFSLTAPRTERILSDRAAAQPIPGVLIITFAH